MSRRMSRSKLVFFYMMSTVIVLIALSFLVFAIKFDYESTKPKVEPAYQENHISVDPKTQAALESMARAFHKWDR